MPGWARCVIALIVLITVGVIALGIYLAYGVAGLALAGLILVCWIICALVEGVGTFMIGRLIERILPTRRHPTVESSVGAAEVCDSSRCIDPESETHP